LSGKTKDVRKLAHKPSKNECFGYLADKNQLACPSG
jgi:hypothetical protein